jgi:hypothetical protein
VQLQTLGWLALFTLVIDLVDLRPQFRSFRFLPSLNYGVYFVLRVILGGVAAVLIATRATTLNTMAVAFVSVLAGFTVLQNFAVNFGGERLVDVSALFDGYRRAMIADESRRIAQEDAARTMALANELSANLDEDILVMALKTMLTITVGAAGARTRINELKALCGKDIDLLKTALAVDMVQLNEGFVRANKDEWFASRVARTNEPKAATKDVGPQQPLRKSPDKPS